MASYYLKLLLYGTIFCVLTVLIFRGHGNYREIIYSQNLKEEIFQKYLKQFNKSYSAEEYKRRLKYFEESLIDIDFQNSRLDHTSNAKPIYGLTKFSDMSREEFRNKMLLGNEMNKKCTSRFKTCGPDIMPDVSLLSNKSIPNKFDWRIQGAVGPVPDQKYCSACWAFSVVGVMQSMAYIRGIDSEPLSVQQVIDCTRHNNGCRGGNVITTLDSICDENKYVTMDVNYPLTLITEGCRMWPKSGRQLKYFESKCKMQTKKILFHIAKFGPVVAKMNAVPLANYIDGVISKHCANDFELMNHIVQIVGYDLTAEHPHYIVKNSWGEDFGNMGYFYIAIDGNVCGINNQITHFDVR